jgi:hypothetical protein
MSTVSVQNQDHLKSAFTKIHHRPLGEHSVSLYAHECDALYAEFCRLANFATLLGEPSPAEMAGIYTREESEAIAADFIAGRRET